MIRPIAVLFSFATASCGPAVVPVEVNELSAQSVTLDATGVVVISLPSKDGDCTELAPDVIAILNGHPMALGNNGGTMQEETGTFSNTTVCVGGAGFSLDPSLVQNDARTTLIISDARAHEIKVVAEHLFDMPTIALAQTEDGVFGSNDPVLVELGSSDDSFSVGEATFIQADGSYILLEQMPGGTPSEASFAVISPGQNLPAAKTPGVLNLFDTKIHPPVDTCSGVTDCDVVRYVSDPTFPMTFDPGR